MYYACMYIHTHVGNGNSATIGGVVGGVVVLILFILFCIVTWIWIRKKKNYKYLNTKAHFTPAVTLSNFIVSSKSQSATEHINIKANEVASGIDTESCK